MQTMGQIHLPFWNLHICVRNFEKLAEWHFCRQYERLEYGLVHLPLWNWDDFHSLYNANYRSGPSAIMKGRWFSLFGQPRLWVRSICYFETYRFIIRSYENFTDWSFLRKLWFLQQLFLKRFLTIFGLFASSLGDFWIFYDKSQKFAPISKLGEKI